MVYVDWVNATNETRPTNAPNWKIYTVVCDTVDMTAMCGDKFTLKNGPFGLTRK